MNFNSIVVALRFPQNQFMTREGKTKVREKVIWEMSDPTGQVKILKLPSASILDNIQWLLNVIIGIIHEK